MKRILITGGACAGKTETIKNIQEKNDNIYVINEIPTMLINNGITASKIGKIAFIKMVFKMYFDFEKNYENIIDSNSILIYDSSPVDMIKFMEKDELDKIFNEFGCTIDGYLKKFDKIIFLDSMANVYPEKFTVSNNSARINDVANAKIRNDILKEFYNDKSIIIGYCETMQEKANKVLNYL